MIELGERWMFPDPEIPDPRLFWIIDEDGTTVRNPVSYKELHEFRGSERARFEHTWLVGEDGEPILVSTVFLCMDCGAGWCLGIKDYMPTLWETMAFKGDKILEQWRYRSVEEAKLGHAEMIEKMKQPEAGEL